MRHVDDTHDAETEREARGQQEQQGRERGSVQGLKNDTLHEVNRPVTLNTRAVRGSQRAGKASFEERSALVRPALQEVLRVPLPELRDTFIGLHRHVHQHVTEHRDA